MGAARSKIGGSSISDVLAQRRSFRNGRNKATAGCPAPPYFGEGLP